MASLALTAVPGTVLLSTGTGTDEDEGASCFLLRGSDTDAAVELGAALGCTTATGALSVVWIASCSKTEIESYRGRNGRGK